MNFVRALFECPRVHRELQRANEAVELHYPYARQFGIDCTHYDADGDFVDIMTPKECAEYTAFYRLLEERVLTQVKLAKALGC